MLNMNLFLKTNFFSEKNRSSSIPNIQSYQLNNIKEKLTTPRPKKNYFTKYYNK